MEPHNGRSVPCASGEGRPTTTNTKTGKTLTVLVSEEHNGGARQICMQYYLDEGRPGSKVSKCSVSISWSFVRRVSRAGIRPAGRGETPSKQKGDKGMRVMVIVPGNKDSEAGFYPARNCSRKWESLTKNW